MPKRPLHVLELTAPLQVIALRQLDLAIHLLLQLGDKTAQVTILHIDPDHDTPLAQLARNLRRAIHHADFRHVGQTRLSPSARGDQDVRDRFYIIPEALRQTHNSREATLTLEDLGCDLAAHRSLKQVVDIGNVQSEARNGLPINIDGQILLPADPLDA